jgi:hypothetical protein
MTAAYLAANVALVIVDHFTDGKHGAYVIAVPRVDEMTHSVDHEFDYNIFDPVSWHPERTVHEVHIHGRDARSIWVADINDLADAVREHWSDLFQQAQRRAAERQGLPAPVQEIER